MNNYFLSRGFRDSKYEEWSYYFSDDDGVKRINKVLIFFYPDLNNIYLLTTSLEDINNKEYLNEVINLVHDLPVDFNFTTEYVENPVDKFLQHKIFEIQLKENYISSFRSL